MLVNDAYCSAVGPEWSVIFHGQEGIDVIEQLSCKLRCFTRDFFHVSWTFCILFIMR
jgi:hypothetical protein